MKTLTEELDKVGMKLDPTKTQYIRVIKPIEYNGKLIKVDNMPKILKADEKDKGITVSNYMKYLGF